MTVAFHRWADLDEATRNRFLTRSEQDITAALNTVAELIERVKNEGDSALRFFNTQFDKTPPQAPLRVPEEQFEEAETRVGTELKEALAFCIENVRRFHEGQVTEGVHWKEIRPGITAGERSTPIDSVGFYVPGGRGRFPSMLYMMAVPASIAGVPRQCLATPPGSDGRVDAGCLVTARLCGIEEVYAVGGAQAWAAFAYGSETIGKVDKGLGPGGIHVAAAKRLLSGVLDCGLPAGPSESIILADGSPNPRHVALDLMVEAEHGSDSTALLITDSPPLAQAVKHHLETLITTIPEPRKTFITEVLTTYGGIILVDGMADGIELVNRLATEHLQIRISDPLSILPLISNAGEIILGEHGPFSAANYAVGANAVLPTGGGSRTWSGLSVRDFRKISSIIRLDAKGLEGLKNHAAALARYEGFPAHLRALTDR